MVGQVKEMLLPPKEGASNDQVKPSGVATSTPVKPPTTKSPPPSQPPKSKMIFATKPKPGPSTSAAAPQPFSGLYKRMAEEDGVNTSSKNRQPNKKKAVTEGDVAFSTSDEVLVIIPIEQALMENGMDSSTFGAGGGGGDAELINNIDIANIHLPNTSKEQQQPAKSGKHPCTEPNCGKHFLSNAGLKRHLRTHSKVKPFGCTYSGCSLEFGQRENALRHIRNIHLKKKEKPGEDAEGEDPNDDEPADPAAYLSVKEELL
ncbi:PREDICTED: Krueppel-like factor 2 [Rhagoletis zephyria]|uniref:Krueppel-like factor 2 n=1 Tax=Rhagoletis zephyria TaxID=28612 RepID=UPI0008118E29|nr:PREDICTED: Krueppel-like factor 2 [Rhagoletis zephyria]